MPFRYAVPRFVAELVRSRGDFARMADRVARRDARAPVGTLLDGWRTNVDHPWKPPGGGLRDAVTHDVVHGLDITILLGIEHPVGEQALRVVLDNATTPSSLQHFGLDLTGIRLEADDLDRASGDGEPLRGRARHLLMVLMLRRPPAGLLSGPATARLRPAEPRAVRAPGAALRADPRCLTPRPPRAPVPCGRVSAGVLSAPPVGADRWHPKSNPRRSDRYRTWTATARCRQAAGTAVPGRISVPPSPFAVNRSDAPAYWSLGELLTMVATAEQTGGAFSVMGERLPKGAEPPPHVHRREDEAFSVLEGGLTVRVVDQLFSASPGSHPHPARGRRRAGVERVVTLAAHYRIEVLTDWP